MTKTPTNPFEQQLRAEGHIPVDIRPMEPGRQAREAQPVNLGLTQEMAHAACNVVMSPTFTDEDRQLFNNYMTGKADELPPGLVERIKHYTLHPEDLEPEDDDGPVGPPDGLVLSIPLDEDLPVGEMWKDIEASLALAAKTCHRVILAVSKKELITGAEVKAVEVSTRTLINLRRSESDYLKGGKRSNQGPGARALHELARGNKAIK